MSEFITRALPELLSFIVDNRGRSCPTVDEGFPLIATNCLRDGLRYPTSENVRYVDEETYMNWFRAHPEPGDVLFVCKGSPGRVAVVPDPVPFCIAQDMVALRADRTVVDPTYLYYRLKSPDVQAAIPNLHVGTMIPHFKKGDFGKLRFEVHTDVGVQRGIAKVLGSLDDKIVSATRKESTAAALIEALYQRAIAAPGTTSEPLMDALTIAFGEPFGGTQFTSPGEGRPLIRIRDLKTFTSRVWTSESRPKEVLVQPGEVVVGMDAEFRPTWWLGQPGLLNQRVCRITSPGAGPAFVREALQAPMARVEGYKTGTTVIHLNKSDLLREQILWPMTEVRAEFDRKAEPILSALVASAQGRESLAAMRDVLLPRLMTGKIGVKDAESVVEGTV